MNTLDRPPLGIRLTLLTLAAVVLMGAASGTFARMSVPQTEPTPGPPTFTPTERFSCTNEAPGEPRGHARCLAVAVPPDDYQPATWTLDPTWPLDANSTELHLVVELRGFCPSYVQGISFVAQHVEERELYVAVTFAVGASGFVGTGPATICPEGWEHGPVVPFVLKLEHPVGRRVLLDAGTDPATVVRQL